MKKQKLPRVVVILILTAITVFVWIGLDVYRVLTQKPAPIVPPEILEPLNPALDSEALTKLKDRTYFSEDSIPTAAPIVTPTSTPISTPISTPEADATPSVEPSNTPTATP